MCGFLIFGKVAGNDLRQRFQIGSGLQALQVLVDFSLYRFPERWWAGVGMVIVCLAVTVWMWRLPSE